MEESRMNDEDDIRFRYLAGGPPHTQNSAKKNSGATLLRVLFI